jgi:uncharacterized protein YcnI
MHRRLTVIALSITTGAFALPIAAQAHVSLHPNVVPAEANVALTLRVPNESDTASTTRVDIQFPPGFLDVAADTPPGWSVSKVTEKLAKPVKTDEGTITTQVREVRLTGGRITPGHFGQFTLAVAVPARPGTVLAFKTVQHYSDGTVTRWIGPASSENPAPTIDLTNAGGVIEDVAGGEAGPPAGLTGTPTQATPAAAVVKNKGASKGLAIAALIIGGLGLATGLAALATRPRGTMRG